MLSVPEASEAVIAAAKAMNRPKEVGTAAAPQAVVCLEDVIADRDFPPFDRVAMDGIAIAFSAWKAGRTTFAVAGTQAAGAPPLSLLNSDQCLEVMTGAALPQGTDTVIRYEDLKIEGRQATITGTVNLELGQHIHLRGSDKKVGDILIKSGHPLHPPQWAAMATVGKSKFALYSRPRIAVIGTGDELVGIDEIPLAHQIRASNIYALAAALADRNFPTTTVKFCGDDPKLLQTTLEQAIANSEVCLITGAVSAGAFDHVPKILRQLKVNEVFHKVAQRPGKPLWFGTVGDTEVTKLVFGLPGNPVSALIACYRYVLPALAAMLGTAANKDLLWPTRYGRLTQEIKFPLGTALTLFAPVKISYDPSGVTLVTPLKGLGSGDLGQLVESDGFIECPKGKTTFAAGEAFVLYSWGLS